MKTVRIPNLAAKELPKFGKRVVPAKKGTKAPYKRQENKRPDKE